MRTLVERAVIMPPPPVITIPSRHGLASLPPSNVALTRRGGDRGFPGLGLSGGYNRDDGPVAVILGATGTGKSKLSIDIGTAFPSEIVNSDKIQVYKGLDLTTNKLPLAERGGIPHHLLGNVEASAGWEMTPAEFRSAASRAIAAIRSRRRLPVVAGGSNSFLHALLARQHAAGRDPFAGDQVTEGDGRLNYRCCLLWVDVEWDVLAEYLDVRVDEMVGGGMVGELARNYRASRADKGEYTGLDRSIGVPEFDKFFSRFPPREGGGEADRWWRKGEREAMEEAVEEVKANTRRLARRQLGKILCMRDGMGWPIRRLDATEAVRRKVEGRGKAAVEEAWERDVRRVAIEEVGRFVRGVEGKDDGSSWRRLLGRGCWPLPEVAGRA